MAVARATILAMRMGRNKGKGWREMLEEESTFRQEMGTKLEMEGKGKEKVTFGFLILNKGEGGDTEELDLVLVSL